MTLPADYVAAAAELGYASTIHGAQGISVDTVHALATGDETRQQLYTALTRGADANHLYLQVVGDGDPHDITRTRQRPPADRHRHPREHPGPRRRPRLGHHHRPRARLPHPAGSAPPPPATSTPSTSPPNTTSAPPLSRPLEAGADRIVPGIADDPAWPTLRAHLILLAATGADPLTALQFAASARELDTADDRAAVLDWRLDDPITAGKGPLPWLPGIPQELRDDPRWGPYLAARSELVADLATEVRHQVTSTSNKPHPGGHRAARSPPRTCSATWPSGEPPTTSQTATKAPPDQRNPSRPTHVGNATSTPAWAGATARL